MQIQWIIINQQGILSANFTEWGVYSLAAIRKAKDTSLKLILDEPELFVEFLRDFVPIEILKDISPSDVEDMTERLLPLLSEQKDLDTIKKINFKNNKPLFVITIIDHESTVNFRASFKMLLYIAFVLDDYEKEVNKQEAEKRKAEDKKHKGKITQTKDFKYPPILPIVFYDGEDEWTAALNFADRTEMNDIFYKYIPKFEYELVSLKKYSFQDLANFNDVLSMFMIIDKIKSAEAFSELGKLPKDYIERLDSMNIPPHLKELLVNIITMLLRKINVPQDEINDLVEQIDERSISQMLSIENYDVQETRREARAEADHRADKADHRADKANHRADKAENRLRAAINSLLQKGNTVTEVADMMGMTEQEIITLLPRLA